jgi:hypothetical protein
MCNFSEGTAEKEKVFSFLEKSVCSWGLFAVPSEPQALQSNIASSSAMIGYIRFFIKSPA